MSELVRTATTLRRIASAAVLAPLLLALLIQSLTPHVHELVPRSPSIESAAAAALPALLTAEPAGCIACRVGSARFGIAGSGISLLFRVSEPVYLLPRELPPTFASRLVRATAPPRAPPA